MRRDVQFPDVVDTDVLSLFAGPIQQTREQMRLLLKRLNNHQDINPDYWLELRDMAERVLSDTADVLCVDCLEQGRETLGEASWTRDRFDGLLCKSCGEKERTR